MELGDATETHDQIGLSDFARVHETTLIDHDHDLSLSIAPIPLGAIPGDPPGNFKEIADALEVEILRELPSPASSFLPHVIASLLLEPQAQAAADRLTALLDAPASFGLDIDKHVLHFAEYSAFEPFILLEESPLKQKALAAAGAAIAVAAIPVVGVPLAILYGGGTIVVFGVGLAVSERVGRWIDPKSA
ncbi:MAG TPA: hypothetical protein VIT89_03165 [Solirubrobacterales bacterium]